MKSSLEPSELGDLASEVKAFRDMGLDGLFSDHPGLAVTALTEY